MSLGKLGKAIYACVLTIGLSVGIAKEAQAVPIPDPTVYYEFEPTFISTSKCMDVPGHSHSNGVGLIIWSCHGFASDGANQLFHIAGANAPGEPTAYRIVNKENNLCWVAFDPSSGEPVSQNSCNISDSRYLWQLIPGADGTFRNFRLMNVDWQVCMAVQDSSGADGTPVVVRPCGLTPITQEWIISPFDANTGGGGGGGGGGCAISWPAPLTAPRPQATVCP